MRDGARVTLTRDDIQFAYRQTDLPEGAVITSVTFRADPGNPEELETRMAEQLAKRDATQPTKRTQRRQHLPQPGGVFQHGAGR